MKKIMVSSLFSAMLILSGCEDNENSPQSKNSTKSNAKIATGYYVDSAVKGISYECGVMEGNTSKDGAFDFEMGEDCVFSFGGFELRHIGANLLERNISILENNGRIAQLLQTIDNDGNATNGLQLGKESGTVLRDLIKERSTDVKSRLLDNLPSGANLQDFLADIQAKLSDKISDYEGRVVPLEESIEHVRSTIKRLGGAVFTHIKESNVTSNIKEIVNILKQGKNGSDLQNIVSIGGIIKQLKEINEGIQLDTKLTETFKDIRSEIITRLQDKLGDKNISSPKDVIANILENVKESRSKFKEFGKKIIERFKNLKKS